MKRKIKQAILLLMIFATISIAINKFMTGEYTPKAGFNSRWTNVPPAENLPEPVRIQYEPLRDRKVARESGVLGSKSNFTVVRFDGVSFRPSL